MKNNIKNKSDIKLGKFELLKGWFVVKLRVHKINRHPRIREGEIWWCNFGENVGVEINGKKGLYLRPVLILKKYNQHFFFGLPLTSKIYHNGPWYAHFNFQDQERVCILSQGRSLSVNRLYRKMGEADEADLAKIRSVFIVLHHE